MESSQRVDASEFRGSDFSCFPHRPPHKVEMLGQQELIITTKKSDTYGPSDVALPRLKVLAYGTGHMFNDLTASCWFTYLLIFLTDVGLSPKQAGVVMLAGQVADAMGTIFVGQLIDKFGKFKLWHAGGSLLVAISFSSVFGGCWTCRFLGSTSIEAHTYGYSFYASVFNLGWAATQVSHMSLVNCLTANATSRVALNSCRNAFTMLANLCLYAIALAVFEAVPASGVTGVQYQYQWIAAMAIIIGCVFTFIFQLGVKEPRLMHHRRSPLKSKVDVSWFRKPLYYQVALAYLLTRLTTNISQALLPFYVIDDLKMGQPAKAVVPGIINVCSFLCSIFMQELNWTSLKLKTFFAGGAALWTVSGAALYFIPHSFSSVVYLVCVIIGAANALMLVTVTSMEGVLVGKNLSSCAFVYGSLSFLEKLACGMGLYVIEGFHGESRHHVAASETIATGFDEPVVRLVLSTFPGSCAFLAASIALTMHFDKEDSSIDSLESLLVPRSQDPSFGLNMLETGVEEDPCDKPSGLDASGSGEVPMLPGWRSLSRALGAALMPADDMKHQHEHNP